MFPKVNKERFEKLKSLSPMDAVRAWLDGDFGFGDEKALIDAILKDIRINLSPQIIEEFMSDAIDEQGGDAQTILDRLAGL